MNENTHQPPSVSDLVPWVGNEIPRFMRPLANDIMDISVHDDLTLVQQFSRMNRLYRGQIDRLRKEAASTYVEAKQLFLDMRVLISFFASYHLEIYGNYSLLDIHYDLEMWDKIPDKELAPGVHVAEVDNTEALNGIRHDLDRLGVWDWPLPPFPPCVDGADGWGFEMSLGCISGIASTKHWCTSPPDYEMHKLSTPLIEFINFLAPAYGYPAFSLEFEEAAQWINEPR